MLVKFYRKKLVKFYKKYFEKIKKKVLATFYKKFDTKCFYNFKFRKKVFLLSWVFSGVFKFFLKFMKFFPNLHQYYKNIPTFLNSYNFSKIIMKFHLNFSIVFLKSFHNFFSISSKFFPNFPEISRNYYENISKIFGICFQIIF